MSELTKEQFDGLLSWLDADLELAAERYEKIRQRLIKIFVCRGCSEAESLADEVINRVALKVEWLLVNYEGDPALYFYGIAQNIFKEYWRKKPLPRPFPLTETTESVEREREHGCLDQCMAGLPEDDQALILRYYQEEKQAKISNRRLLADELGITLDALRIRAYRIRQQLRRCFVPCLEQALAQ